MSAPSATRSQSNASGSQPEAHPQHATSPTTPPKKREDTTPKAKTTPQSRAASSSARDMTRFEIVHVTPILREDILNTESVSISRFLDYTVKLLYAKEDDGSRSDILTKILDCTVKIANGQTPPCKRGTREKLKEKIPLINSNLITYCKTSSETDRYQHFVKACNAALDALALVDIGPASDIPAQGIYFQRHDPTHIKGYHFNGETNDRKPDVIVAEREFVIQHLKANGHPNDLDKIAHEPIKKFIPWKSVFSSYEFKKKLDQLNEQAAALEARCYTLPKGDGETLSQEALNDMVAEYVSLMSPSMDRSVPGPSEASGPVSEKKRKQPDSQKREPPKKNTKIDLENAAPVVIQAAGYGAEAFNGTFARANLTNWIITDSRAQLWYFDRECPIQTSDFDFIRELPLFLAFLFLLQRFERKHWGYIPGMSSNRVPYKTRDEHRTSSIFSTTEERSSWSEAEFIIQAEHRCAKDPVALRCIPELVAHQDFDEFNTSTIRKFFGFNLVEGRSRTARALFFIRYEPITNLTTDWTLFMSAFWKLVYTHAALWICGIEHGDISLNNIMWDPTDRQPKLCDYDLAHITGDPRPAGHSNTGTRLFMASELLTGPAVLGGVAREYRHDCESFAWVLIWVLGRYRNGAQIENPDFSNWRSPDYRTVKDEREKFYADQASGVFKLRDSRLPDNLFEKAYIFYNSFRRVAKVLESKVPERVALGENRYDDAEEKERKKLELGELTRQVKELSSIFTTLSNITKTSLFKTEEGASQLAEQFKALMKVVGEKEL
ncbi:hypothetical protein AAF712_006667 [Marasmius tenuissimus]|uniref:Fungal-type protein kinase domain-containing protein n=1 Tax=Marasmius tenuissimus TaxID=585030 RepID=A0ABR3A106_9AGAR